MESTTNRSATRRCVICGAKPPKHDVYGKKTYHYPKTMNEARIWQRSMAANDVCLESIQEECCVCIEHIPQFVARAAKNSAKFKENEEADEELRSKLQSDAAADLCQCDDNDHDGAGMNRPSVNVLLLSGATLPSFCGKAFDTNCHPEDNKNGDEEPKPDRKKHLPIKREKGSESDTEIYVLESDFKDSGAKFPDIDETEVTVMRTPTQDDDELDQIAEEFEEDESCLGRRDQCMTGCTDVLLLGRGLHPTDVCPCECDHCTKKPTAALDDEVCCNPPCCPEPPPPEYFDHPPCGCECEQQVRRELGKVIKKQKNRIRELEELLCRQHKLHHCLQTKVDELYCEFGRVDEEDRTRLMCCAREPPNCAEVVKTVEVIQPAAPEETIKLSKPKKEHKQISPKNEPENEKETSQPRNEDADDVDDDLPDRVHLYSTKNPDYKSTYRTRHPTWVSTVDGSDSTDSLRSENRKRQITDDDGEPRVKYKQQLLKNSTERKVGLKRQSIVSKSTAIRP